MTRRARSDAAIAAVVHATAFLDLVGFGLVVPLLPLAVRAAGGAADLAGAALGVYSLAQLVAAPVLGRLADRVGRRPVVLLSLAGNALSMVLFAIAVERGLLPLLFASRVLGGATAGNLATLQLVIADTTPVEDRPARLGRMGASIGLGMVAGPLLGGSLMRLGPGIPAAGAALAAACALVLAAIALPETRPAGAGRPSAAAYREAPIEPEIDPPAGLRARVLALPFVGFFCVSALQATFPLHAGARLGLGPAAVGAAFGGFGVVLLLVQGVLVAPLARRASAERLAAVGPLLMAIGLAGLALAGSAAAAAPAGLAVACGIGLLNPLATAIASSIVPADKRGRMLGQQQAASTLGRVLGPVVGGAIYAHASGAAAYFSAAIAAAAGVLVALGIGARGALDRR